MSSKPKNFSQALDDLENLTHLSGSDLKRKLQDELHDLEEKIHKLKPQLEDLKEEFQDEVKKTKSKIESRVKDNPWATLGIIGLIFFVLGFLLAGRRSRD